MVKISPTSIFLVPDARRDADSYMSFALDGKPCHKHALMINVAACRSRQVARFHIECGLGWSLRRLFCESTHEYICLADFGFRGSLGTLYKIMSPFLFSVD